MSRAAPTMLVAVIPIASPHLIEKKRKKSDFAKKTSGDPAKKNHTKPPVLHNKARKRFVEVASRRNSPQPRHTEPRRAEGERGAHGRADDPEPDEVQARDELLATHAPKHPRDRRLNPVRYLEDACARKNKTKKKKVAIDLLGRHTSSPSDVTPHRQKSPHSRSLIDLE